MDINLTKTALGIELGSTRIKAVLIDENFKPIASGSHDWENQFVNNIWTYDLEAVWEGIQDAYQKLAKEFKGIYNKNLTTVGSLGFSAMMHGYLPFDKEGNQLVPFRTWRNTTTEESSEKLSNLFQFNIPQRWSISHLYQAILNEEKHVKEIDFLTTLAGYVHWKLTGEKVLGVGEAAGMFPIDSEKVEYNSHMLEQFEELIESYSFDWKIEDILPTIKIAGENGGYLTEEGAKLLDPTGTLEDGIPFAPPEGDAGTGMVATNSVAVHTGNVSAGTSIFSMIVLEEELSDYYVEIDMVTTPTGKPVAMVHCNNFTSDINDWIGLFKEVMAIMDTDVDNNELFTRLYQEALNADPDVGRMVGVNYYSGEPITDFEEGRPLFVRMPDSKLNVSNFMRSQIYSALATLKIGMNILTEKERVQVDHILGHGGFFRTEKVGQQIMADVLNTPVSVMETAGEGGPWGMAILARYSVSKREHQSLVDYLEDEVFVNQKAIVMEPEEAGIKSFTEYMERYKKVLNVERSAVDNLKDEKIEVMI